MTAIASHILAAPPWVALLLVFALPALESSAFVGFIFPGEIALILGGVLAYQGRVPLVAVLAAGIAGAVVGDSVGYAVGRRYGRRILDGTLGRFVHGRHLDRAEAYLAERGGKAVFFGRFTAALRVMIPGLAGMSGLRYRTFLTYNVASAIGWGTLSVMLGYLGGSSRPHVEHTASHIGLAALLAFVLAVLGGFLLRRCSPTRAFRAAPDPAAANAAVDDTPRVVIVSASMGAGHDGAAAELGRRASALGYRVDRVDFLTMLPLGVGPVLRAIYRVQLLLAPATWGWMLPLLGRREARGWAANLPARMARTKLREALTPEPCLVLSTYPLASQALSQLRLSGHLTAPAVTFLTDMSVHPLWIAAGIDSHLALHDIPAAQARTLGARDVQVCGPAVAPAFQPATASDRRTVRDLVGLPFHGHHALVVAGSWGVGDIISTVEDLLATALVTPVVVCGRNTLLYRAVARLRGAVVLGWVDDMPTLMRACDLVVQNAGGLTSLEARQSGLPVITYRCLPGHGTTNAAALEDAGWATWARNLDELSALAAQAIGAPAPVTSTGGIPWALLTGRLMEARA